MTDTWFIGQTNDPYMVAAAVMVATVFLMVQTIANIFGVGGGNLLVNLLGSGDREEARKVGSLSLVMAGGFSLLFSIICFLFRRPLLLMLGASEYTYDYAMHYLLVVIILGSVPTVLANTMNFMLRNVGYVYPS